MNGIKHGEGTLTYSDNSYYTGTFEKNEFNGYGEYFWNDGRVYKGEWLNGKMHGKGEFTWPDSKVYIGEYRNDKKEGYGIFTWPDGKIYKGEWIDGSQHGYGIFISTGEYKLGEFVNGKKINWINKSDDIFEVMTNTINNKLKEKSIYVSTANMTTNLTKE